MFRFLLSLSKLEHDLYRGRTSYMRIHLSCHVYVKNILHVATSNILKPCVEYMLLHGDTFQAESLLAQINTKYCPRTTAEVSRGRFRQIGVAF